MGKWILDLINISNAFWLSVLDKCIKLVHEVTTGGRKMTVTIFSVFCMTTLAIQQLVIMHTLSEVLVLCIAGVVGFFSGVNILGDHILNGKDSKPSKDQSKDGE
jgi:hypothetical protein